MHLSRQSNYLLLLSLLGLATSIYAQQCLNAIGVPTNLHEVSTQLYRGQQDFSMRMLELIRKSTPTENIFFSPYSTFHALLLAYFGANGATEKELRDALRLNWAKSKADVRTAYRLEKKNREMNSRRMPSLEFTSADRIYFDTHIQLSSCLETVLAEELISMNLRQDPEAGRHAINAWIANVTHNEITEVLSAGDVDANTNVVLANAAYFKGQWASQFDPKDTKWEQFHTSGSQASLVEMMHKKGNYLLTIDENLGAYVLQMPYLTKEKKPSDKDDNDDFDAIEDSSISMVIVLPPTVGQLEDVLAKLKPDTIKETLEEGMSREIEISLPKFEFEQRLELVPILRNMGINSIFDSQANFTDFTADESITFGDAKHVAKIKVDEEGSTAAAATVLVSFRSARPIEPTKFICNHPFLFLIYDKKSNAVLFTGIYRDPKTKH